MTVVLLVISSLLTYELSKVERIGPVRSSCLVTIFLSGIVLALSLDSNLVVYAFGGSFVGMSSFKKFTRLDMVFAAILFYGIYKIIFEYSAGYGGALGFSAFISILIIYIFKYKIIRSQGERNKYKI